MNKLYFLKYLFFRLRLRFLSPFNKAIAHSKFYNIKIGKNVRFTGNPNWGSEPFLIEIGDNVTITQNVTFHTHDGGVWVFREKYPFINVFGKIIVGNNVFIGSNTIILPDVTIGDNVVIGTGSIVTKSIPPNVVVAGVPAKIIKTIFDYEKSILGKSIILKEKTKDKRKEIIINHINNFLN